MDNQQDSQPWSPETPRPASKPAEFSVWTGGLDILAQFVHDYPLIFWGGVWAMLLLLAGIAVTGLMDPELSTQDKPVKPDPAQVVLSPGQAEQGKSSPVATFAAIAVGCAAGCLLLSKQLNRVRSRPPVVEPEDLEGMDASNRPHANQVFQERAAIAPPPSHAALPPQTQVQSSLPPASLPEAHLRPQPSTPSLPSEAPGLAELRNLQQRQMLKKLKGWDRQQPDQK